MDAHPDDKVFIITTTPPISVGRDSTLREAASTLSDANVGAVIVIGGEQPVGIMSERDIVRALAEGADPDQVWSADVMSPEPRYVATTESIEAVAKHMVDIGVRHMPVFDEGELVGMVSARDALHVFSDALER